MNKIKNFKNWGAINCAECAAIRVITVNMINGTINEIKIASPRMQMIGIRQTFLTFEFFLKMSGVNYGGHLVGK